MEDRDLVKLQRHIRNAWITGCISAGMTLVAGILGIVTPETMARYGIDAWSIVDALLIAALAFGVYHESRFCALGLLAYFLAAKIIMAIDSGNYPGLGFGMLFIYFYFRGAVATFQLRKHRVEAGLVSVKDRRRLAYAAAGTAGALFAAFVVLVIFAALGPDNQVVPGKQVKAGFVEEIRDLGLLGKNEEIVYFYSNAFYSIRSGFYFFTGKNVVLYSDDWERPSIIVPYGAITAIELIDGPDAGSRRINIHQRTDTVLSIPMPDNGTDYRTFYEVLVKNWKSNK